jgi:hypothetical protein
MGSAPLHSHLKITFGLVLMALLTVADAAASINWTTLTSLKDVRRMRIFHDSIFVVTSGGLMIISDPAKPGKVYDNLSGIGATDLTDLIQSADGQRWIAAQGSLIKFNANQSDIYPFLDNDGNEIRLLCLADDGNNLWVGTSIGLVLFSKVNDDGQIQDSYTMFGTLSASPAVNDILLVGDSIWLATSAGVAVANRTAPNLLKVPSSWKTYGPDNLPELGTSQPRRIVQFESAYYIGTSLGLFRLDRGANDTLVSMPAGSPVWVTELKVENDSLFFYVPDGLGVIKNGVSTLLGTFGLPIFPINGANTGTFRMFGLLGESGLYDNASGSYQLYPYTGIPQTAVQDVVIGRDGTVTGLFASKKAYQQTDTGWAALLTAMGTPTVGAVDSSGDLWLGTFGDGLWRVTADSFLNYDETNTSMRGNTDINGASYVVVKGEAIDERYVYVACYRALNGYPVAIGDLTNLNSPSGWDSLGISDGITDNFVTSLDHYGSTLAVGTAGSGLFVIELGADPRDKSDDSTVHYTVTATSSAHYLISDDVSAVRFSPQGDLWVGTNVGVVRQLAGYPRFETVDLLTGFGPEVSSIEFDSRGNVWLGSINGVTHYDATIAGFENLNSQNSGLVNDAVHSIKYNGHTGDMYIATDGGISIAASQYGKPTTDVKQILAFPNPFVIRSSSDILRFNFALSAKVRILTVAGDLVAQIDDINQGWDGRNSAGKPVASGVYFFIVSSTSDESSGAQIGNGKFLLVREQ